MSTGTPWDKKGAPWDSNPAHVGMRPGFNGRHNQGRKRRRQGLTGKQFRKAWQSEAKHCPRRFHYDPFKHRPQNTDTGWRKKAKIARAREILAKKVPA